MSSPTEEDPLDAFTTIGPKTVEIEASIPPPLCLLRRTCHQCDSLADTAPCIGCGMVVYCSPGHRILDIPHNKDCSEIQRRRLELKDPKPDDTHYTPRHDLISYLYTLDTYEALSSSLSHAWTVLKADRQDRFGIRDQIPFLLLRLGLDQTCYDFCVAWTNEEQMKLDPQVTYDFSTPQPFAIPSQDMLEMYEFRFDVANEESFGHAVAMVLLKVRLLLRIMIVPESKAMNEVKARVTKHLEDLCNSITGVFPNFWPKVIEEIKRAGASTTLRDDVVFDGLGVQAVRTLVSSIAVWKESPGAIQLLESMFSPQTQSYTFVFEKGK